MSLCTIDVSHIAPLNITLLHIHGWTCLASRGGKETSLCWKLITKHERKKRRVRSERESFLQSTLVWTTDLQLMFEYLIYNIYIRDIYPWYLYDSLGYHITLIIHTGVTKRSNKLDKAASWGKEVTQTPASESLQPRKWMGFDWFSLSSVILTGINADSCIFPH